MESKTVNLRDVPEELVRRAKAYAAMRGVSLKQFILDAVEKALNESMPATSMSFFATTKRAPKKSGRKGHRNA
jgi:hypothetical protein